MHQTHLQRILLPSLARTLHETPSLDDGLRLSFYPARIVKTYVKSGEWEMNVRQEEFLLIAFRGECIFLNESLEIMRKKGRVVSVRL